MSLSWCLFLLDDGLFVFDNGLFLLNNRLLLSGSMGLLMNFSLFVVLDGSDSLRRSFPILGRGNSPLLLFVLGVLLFLVVGILN